MVKIITIDGPSGCGKSSVTQKLSNHLGYHWLDSGALYRICAWLYLNNPNVEYNELLKTLHSADIRFIASQNDDPSLISYNNTDITLEVRSDIIAQQASLLSQNSLIREGLVKIQHDFVKPPGIVAEGRDMGTVIFPQADFKFYLTANVKVRAERRLKQLQSFNKNVNLSALIDSMKERDYRDMHRPIAPLVAAEGAFLIDASYLSLDDVVQKVICLIS